MKLKRVKHYLIVLKRKILPTEYEKKVMMIASENGITYAEAVKVFERKKKYTNKISEKTGHSVEFCLERMERICKELQLNDEEYFEKKFYELHEMTILNRLVVNSKEFKSARMDDAVEKTGKTQEEIKERIDYVREKYGISASTFFNKDIMFFSDEMIEKELNKIDYISKLSDITGKSYDDCKVEIENAIKKFGITARMYKNRNYFNMSDEQIVSDLEKRKDATYAMLKDGSEATGKSIREFMMEAKLYSIKYGSTMGDYYNFKLYEKSPEVYDTWIRHISDSRRLKRKYRLVESDILENKVKFNQIFKSEIGRKWWTNSSDATLDEFIEFVSGLDEIIVKPVSMKQGVGIYKIDIKQRDINEIYSELMKGDVVIVEECIKQHHEISEFYPDCVHCCRIVAILDNDKCYFPQTSMKFGVSGIADNIAAGGFCANINPETGIISTDGANKKGEKVIMHPYSNKIIKGFKIPYWKETLELVERLIIKVPGINYVGFDIAITEYGPIVVEGNDSPDLRLFEYPVASETTGLRHHFKPFIDEYVCNW